MQNETDTKLSVMLVIEQRYSVLWDAIRALPTTEFNSKTESLTAIENIGLQATELKKLWSAWSILKH